MLAWCSSAETRISSSARRLARPPGLRDQVDGLGGAAREDDFARIARIDEALHGRARLFMGGGRLGAQGVHAAMDIGVLELVIMPQPIDHHRRLVGGGGIVGIHQRLAVHLARKNGKVEAHALDVERSGSRPVVEGGCGVHGDSSELCN
jgi:hypothetical protein